jgi:hypothetical protein
MCVSLLVNLDRFVWGCCYQRPHPVSFFGLDVAHIIGVTYQEVATTVATEMLGGLSGTEGLNLRDVSRCTLRAIFYSVAAHPRHTPYDCPSPCRRRARRFCQGVWVDVVRRRQDARGRQQVGDHQVQGHCGEH